MSTFQNLFTILVYIRQIVNVLYRRRIDHRKLIANTMFAIETDDFGHRSYDPNDEEIRYDDFFW